MPFAPSDISGLVLWLKADAGTTLTGANITAWTDQSTAANNGTAVGTPTLVTGAINGLPAAHFIDQTKISFAAQISGKTFFIVVKDNGSPSYAPTFGTNNVGSAGVAYTGWFEHGIPSGASEPGGVPSLMFEQQYPAGTRMTSGLAWEDATSVNPATLTYKTAFHYYTFQPTDFVAFDNINQGSGQANRYGVQDIVEVIVYNSTLSSGQINQVQVYLATRTALASPPVILALSAGTVTVTGTSLTEADLSITAPANGTGPYSYQLHRSTVSGFTPATGTAVTGASGAILGTVTKADTGLTSGTTYYYKVVYGDAASGAATSTQVSAVPRGKLNVVGAYNSFGTISTIPAELVTALTPLLPNYQITYHYTTHSGYQTSQLTALYDTETAPLYDSTSGVRNILYLCEITNDLAINSPNETPASTSAAATYGRMLAFTNKGKVTGFQVGANVPLKRANSGNPATFEPARLAFLPLINGAVTSTDLNFIYDPTTDSRLGDPTNQTYFDSLFVHPNATGSVIYAGILAQSIANYVNGVGGGGSTPVATTLTVSPSTMTSLVVGATQQFTATVRDQFGATMTGQTVTWASSNTSVATVNPSSGLVTAIGAGTATITASDGSITRTATVTVPAPSSGGGAVRLIAERDLHTPPGSGSTPSLALYVGDKGTIKLFLKADGESFNLTGYAATVSTTAFGNALTTNGAVSVHDAADGSILYALQTADTAAEIVGGSLTVTVDNGSGARFTFGSVQFSVLAK